MKRFTLGFMKSISSSYEVEMSDGSSSTIDASNVSHCTEEDNRSYRSSKNDSKSNGFGFFGNRESDSWEESSSSSEDDESTSGSTVSEKLDEISNLPDKTLATQIVPRRTSSDLSICTAASGGSFSSHVAQFLSAVDSTVDVMVDALLPVDESFDNKSDHDSPSFHEPTIDETTDKIKKPTVFRKAVSLTRRSSKIDTPSIDSRRSRTSRSRGIGEAGDDYSTTSSFSAVSFLKRSQIQKEKLEEKKKGQDDSSSDTSKRSFFKLIANKNATYSDTFDTKTETSSVKTKEQPLQQERKENRRKHFRFGRRNKNNTEKVEGRDDIHTENEERSVFMNEAASMHLESPESVFDCFFRPVGLPEPVLTQEFESDEEKTVTKGKRKIFKRFRKKKNDNIQLLQKQKYSSFN